MRGASAFLVGLATVGLIGCALSHHAGMDGGPRTDTRPIDGMLDVPRDGGDVPIPPADGDAGCPPGTQLCGGSCVSVNAPDHCGSCSNDCTTLPGVNASAVTCAAGTCSLTGACATGRADCDSTAPGCETVITDATHCGACTTTCSGGTPVCADDGSGHLGCTSGCPTGQVLCGTSTCADTTNDVMNCGGCGMACPVRDHAMSTCAGSTCASTCIAGYHDCSGTCVDSTLPTSCGAMCTTCPAPANATPTCASGTCGFTCNAGYHRCGSDCVSDNDVATCGSRCSACPTMAGATATCASGACGFTCNSGFHACGSGTSLVCASDTDPTRCGTACMMCSGTTNGSATCSSGTCSVSCGSGFHACTGAGGTTCESDTDINHCGASCAVCTVPMNGRATCMGGACGIMCNTGYAPSGSMCMAVGPTCGNRILESGETCDDGNRTGGDGCNSSCQMEIAIVDSCTDAHTTIAIADRGMHIYTGTTTGRVGNGPGACLANGPDVIWQTTITISGAFTYTVSLAPSGWNAVMRQDATCPTNTCVIPTVPGTAVSYSGSGTNSTTWNFAADSIDGTSGNFTLSINVP